MDPIYPSTGAYENTQVYQFQNTPDPFDEFLAQFLRDVPTPVPTSSAQTSAQTSAPISVPAAAQSPTTGTAPGSLPEPLPLTCHWFSQQHNPPRVCGAPISPDVKHACAHFRQAHAIRGNDRVTVSCHWYGCNAAPMQRGSVIRHLLSVHLGLLRWRCETCGRVFSRRGTIHACDDQAVA